MTVVSIEAFVAKPAIVYTISVPMASFTQICGVLLPEVSVIVGSGSIVIFPVTVAWSAGLLQAKSLFIVAIV